MHIVTYTKAMVAQRSTTTPCEESWQKKIHEWKVEGRRLRTPFQEEELQLLR